MAARALHERRDLVVGELVAEQIDGERGLLLGQRAEDLARERAGLAAGRRLGPAAAASIATSRVRVLPSRSRLRHACVVAA